MKYLLSIVVTLAACVSDTDKQGTSPRSGSSDERVVCTEETPTGDLIPRKVCRTEHIKNEDRRGADDFIQRPTSHPTTNK